MRRKSKSEGIRTSCYHIYNMFLKITPGTGSKDKLDCFRALVGVANTVGGQVVFYPGLDGLFLQCIDAGKCCLFEASLSRTWFDEYTETEDAWPLPVFGRILTKVLGTVSGDETLTLQASQDSCKLDVVCSRDGERVKRTFGLPIIASEEDKLVLPEAEAPDAQLVVNCKTLADLLDQVALFDNHVTWKIFNKDDEVELHASSENGSIALDVDITEGSGEEGGVSQTFSTQWFRTMSSLAKHCPEATIDFRRDRPVIMTLPVAEESYVRFCLSPYTD